MSNVKITSEKSYKYRYFREESNRLLLAPFRALAKFTAIAGLFALIFEVRSFAEHSAEVYLARLGAILVAFGLLVLSNTKFGKNHPVALVHTLLLSIIGSFGVIIYLIPETVVFNSHIIGLIIFTAALFLSWEVTNQIVVAIYYNLVFSASILLTDRSVYIMPNMFESVLLVLFISAMAVAASSINYRLRKDAIFKSFEVSASEKRFRNIFENSAEGIFQESIDGRFIIANPSLVKMLGYKSQDEVKALDVPKDVYKNEEDRNTLTKLLQKQGKVRNYRLVLKKKDGTHIVVKANVRLITDNDENPLYYEGSLQDITQQVQAEYERQKALDALKMEKIKADQAASKAIEESGFKTRFLANMSHEVRTPMNSILGYLDLIENGLYEDAEELQTFAKSGRLSAQALLETINNILDLSKIEAGKMELDEVEFSVKKELEKAVSIISQTAKDKKLKVYQEYDDMIPHSLFGDATRFRQILLNLLANSVKYTDEGRIDVKVELLDQENDIATIKGYVKDTGKGISKEAQKMLFRPFSQVHSVRSNQQGTGLGLVICKEFTNLMGGDIEVDSDSGKGSTFSFTVQFGLRPQSIEHQIEYSNVSKEVVEEVEQEKEAAKPMKEEKVTVEEKPVVKEEKKVEKPESDKETVEKEEEKVSLEIEKKELTKEEEPEEIKTEQKVNEVEQNEAKEEEKEEVKEKVKQKSVSFENKLKGTDEKPAEPEPETKETTEAKETKEEEQPKQDERTEFKKAIDKATAYNVNETRKRVLLVEDNPISQNVETKLLKSVGYHVEAVSSGEEAVKAVSNGNYDVVLMDIEMPEMDGLKATQKIRELEGEVKSIPVIAVTAHSSMKDREKCLAAGLNDYIAKPISINFLKMTIDQWINTKK